MLVVIAIMAIMMASANVLFRSPVSKAGEPSARLARCVELARSTAVASNRTVALRFEPRQSNQRDTVLRFLWKRPGAPPAAKLEEFRRPEKFTDVAIVTGIDLGKGSAPTGTRELAPEESLLFTTDGQALIGTGSAPAFPTPSDKLERSIDIGIQSTSGGKIISPLSRDVAIVRIQPASGTAIALQP